MNDPDQCVIIVRAWRESDGIRVRVLADNRDWVAGSVDGAVEIISAVLTELAARVDD